MSLFSHNKCGKITIKHWELDLFFNFTFYLFGGGGACAPNGALATHLPAYGPVAVLSKLFRLSGARFVRRYSSRRPAALKTRSLAADDASK